MIWCNSLENWHFLIFKVHFQWQNSTKPFRKWFSYLNMWIVEQLSSRTFYHYLSFWSTLLVKMCPIFDGSASNHFTRYQKILWVCSLECKKLLNFICLTMKFLNRHHASVCSSPPPIQVTVLCYFEDPHWTCCNCEHHQQHSNWSNSFDWAIK